MFAKNKPSPAQIHANRLNAQKSTGPRTEEGKNRSRCNALRHGLTSQVTVMTDPDRDAQEKFIKAYVADLAPEGFPQTQLAQSLAHDQWRMNRIRAIEENQFSAGFTGAPGNLECGHPEIHSAMSTCASFFDDPAAFATLSLYEQRLHRNFHRNLKTYREMQAERRSAPKPEAPAQTEKPRSMTASAAATAEPNTEAIAQPAPKSTSSEEIGFDRSTWNRAPDYVPRNPTAHEKPASEAA